MGESSVVEQCAGGIVFDESRRLLLIRRAQPPAQGRWSVPGGRCLPGEDARDACVRELAEETGLTVSVSHLAGRVERDRPAGGIFVIDDFVCRVVTGRVRAGDDAADAGWFTGTDLAQARDAGALAPLLWETLAGWDLLPA